MPGAQHPVSREAWDRRRRSFGEAASTYERYRPGYPAEAIRWLLGEHPCRVLDLGAGTGKLSRELLGAGHEVVALEPDASMRAILVASVPGAQALEGSAEAIPLAPGSVDAVVAGQAWHWFDPARALPEIARVLRPGGTLGVVWNGRDEAVPWIARLESTLNGDPLTTVSYAEEVAELEALLADARHDAHDRGGPLFSSVEHAAFRHVQVLDVEELVGLAASRSYTIVLPEQERTELLERVAELGAREAARSPGGRLTLPYVTVCVRATLVD